MCTNQREIVNKYTGHKLYVKCGKCPACLQEKAAYRVSRIKANDSPGLDAVMVTLTYARHCCPYILRNEAYSFAHQKNFEENDRKRSRLYFNSDNYRDSLSVYRDKTFRKVRINANYDIDYKVTNERVKLCDVDFSVSTNFKNCKDLKYEHDKIGVCYYPDVQDFIERLRLNLKRKYSYEESFKMYCCSEYGSKSLRPHFHLLFWIKKGDFELFRNAVIASWPYGNLSKFDRAIERAFRASSYVASYVNCSTDFPDFLKVNFKAKHSYSKGFGFGSRDFSLFAILEKFYRGNLTVSPQKEIKGIPTIVECPIPTYVISRYFPKYKGFNRLSDAQRIQVASRICRFSELSDIKKKAIIRFVNGFSFPVYYSDIDFHQISVRLNNAYQRFCDCYRIDYKSEPPSLIDYLELHSRIWNLYSSDCLRLNLQNEDVPIQEKYDNLEEIKCKYESDLPDFIDYPLPVGFTEDMLLVVDPNGFLSVIGRTVAFTRSYYEHDKKRRVINTFLSSQYEEY